MAENPITTQWVEVFDSCTRYSKVTTYVEYSRFDACAAPEQSVETLCTWFAALGRSCAYRGTPVDWMNNQNLSDYCTRDGRFDSIVSHTALEIFLYVCVWATAYQYLELAVK